MIPAADNRFTAERIALRPFPVRSPRESLRLLAHNHLVVVVWLITLGAKAQSPELTDYEIGFADGSRTTTQRIAAWSPEPPALKLDDHDLWNAKVAVRWIRKRGAPVPLSPTAWVETWTGDRLPGCPLRYDDPSTTGQPGAPPHLVVESLTSNFPPRQNVRAEVRVRLKSIRRVVWQDTGRRGEPGLAIMRDGRQLRVRAARWNAQTVVLLTDQGSRSIAFDELAELNLPPQSPWTAWIEELALLAPDGTDRLLQMETAQGILATTSWRRQRVVRPPDESRGDQWQQGVQPAWSLDVLWFPGRETGIWRFFQTNEMPLSRIPPTEVVQRSPLSQQGRPWQRDRNVDGGWLRSGSGVFGWGLGVHAHNELQFLLPEYATSFSSFVGLDTLAGAGGCVRARVLLQSTQRESLFETPYIVGSEQVYASGLRRLPDGPAPRTLVLQVDYAHQQRPGGADPLDIRDSTDWLEPLLYFDPTLLSALITQAAPSHLFACRDWHWHVPPTTRLHCCSVWDEISESASRFAPAVAVEGGEPLSLIKRQQIDDTTRHLILTVSCSRPADPPVRIEVLAAGERLSLVDVPTLDRRHLDLSPHIIPLDAVNVPPDGTVEFEIRQYPGSVDTPVQWHAIEFQ